MKKISDTKNSEVKKKKEVNNSKGFTLVELLAVIAILSIVLTVVIFVAINVLDNAKEESYKVTINNIQADANSYVVEDNSVMPWMNGITSDYQYQCITVQNLIDTGYFKGDVLESEVASGVKVSADNFIYLERDAESKTITKNILLVNDKASYDAGLCGNISTGGNISFTVEPEGWSKEKEITVTYNVHSNIDRVSNYKYDYVYEDINSNKKDKNSNFNKLTMVEKFEINENGTVSAKIKDGDNKLITNNSLVISKIDNILPEASITSTNNVANSQTATLKMSDNAGVVAYYFGKNNPNSTAVTWTNIDSTTSKSVTGKVDSSGTWYLGVKDVVGHVVVVSKVFYKTTLSISNATVEPSTIITMSGNMFTIPTASPNAYYTFYGWYTSSSYSGSAITTHKPTKDATIYGKVTENKLAGGSVKINGKSTYGETLTTTLTDTSPKADSYTYQWYYNSSNSKTGGTAISGATSNSYTIGPGLVGKYIYVVVTATKNNYRSTSFGDITDSSNNTTSTIAKRNLTITAKGQTITYGDAISTGTSQITSSGLASGDSVTEITLKASTTNVTSNGTITPSVAVVNKGNTVVTTDYAISYKTGKLVINRKSVTVPTADAYCKAVTYNGSEQTITNSAGTGYSFSGNKKTNAGTYTVTATLNGNYKWSDDTTGTKTFDCSIAKKALTITAKAQTITYGDAISTGTGQITSTGLVSGHSITAITLKASTTNVTSNGTITPSAATVKSGSTVVTSNYSISYKTGKLVINKKSATIPTASAYCKSSLVYNSSEQTITNAAGTGYSFSGNKKTNAGTYTVTATLNGNYKWSDNTTGTKTFKCSIAKKAPTMTVSPTTLSLTVPTAGSFTYTYDGDGTVSCSSSSTTNATCKVDTSKKTVTVTPVASGSATITLSAAAGTNYSATSKNVSVTVVATYSVTYDANGGSGAPSAGTKTHGTDYTISSTKPKRDGYSFVNWTTNKDGSGTSYNPGDKYKTNAVLKLYAQWEALTFETKFGYPKYQLVGSVWAWSVHSTCTSASKCNVNNCNNVGTIPKGKDIYYVQKDSQTSSSTYFIDIYVKVDDLSTVGAAVNPPSVSWCKANVSTFKEPAYLEFNGDKYVYARIPAKCNDSSCGTFRCQTTMLIPNYCIYCSSRSVYTDPNIGACPNG